MSQITRCWSKGVVEVHQQGWSAQALSVWGKTCRETGDWMPVVQHLDDAAAVAGLLWDQWLSEAIRRRIEADLPTDACDGRRLVMWLAGVHDVGKCSPAFAVQMEQLAAKMNAAGLHAPTQLANRSSVPHALVGEIALRDWLMDHGAPPYVADSYADVVGAHHGRANTKDRRRFARDRKDLLGDGEWQDVRCEILDGMAGRVDLDGLLAAWIVHPLPPLSRMLVSAVVVLADWLASDQERFPLVRSPRSGAERALIAWNNLDLPVPWQTLPDEDSTTDDLLWSRFPSVKGLTARPVQDVCLELSRAATSPSLLIVEAPMGTGKTEAALLAAEQLAAHGQHGGAFIALPTMATSDAMFRRVRSWVEHLPESGRRSMFLAHGKAALNDDFAGMVARSRVSSIYDEDGERTTGADAEVVANSWFSGRRKGVLADVVVGTVDQVLYLALHQKFLSLRHLALAGKVVVIDEVHAADDVMRVFLTRTLEWLAAYGVPVVLLSATLPSRQRQELIDAYRGGLGAPVHPPGPTSYPAVTAVSREGVVSRGLEPDGRRTSVELGVIGDDLEVLRHELADLLRDGGCAAVIRNTVARAQETYAVMQEMFGNDVVLFHSRFLAVVRARREAELRDKLGPEATNRPARLIVVGTQVLEQSLDVDFDVMVSDLAPADLVLQRAGRLHRHHRPLADRPEPVRRPRLLLTGITEWDANGMPGFDSGLTAVYPRSLLLRTAAALGLAEAGVTTLEIPGQVQAIVESVYADEPEVPSAWAAAVATADDQQRKHQEEVRARATPYVLDPVPEFDDAGFDTILSPGADDPDGSRSGSSVRDGEDGLEVILVRRDVDGVRLMPGDFDRAEALVPDLLGPPDDLIARVLATCTVRLPSSMTGPWAFDEVLDHLEEHGYDGWQQSRWLKGALVLTLDRDFEATVGSFKVQYDEDAGLRVESCRGAPG